MLIKAEQKYVRVSPRKLRLVLDAVRSFKRPDEMLVRLETLEKRASLPLAKALKQAVANATNNLGLPRDSLRVKELQVTKGPVLKRGRPVSRGRFHPIKKYTSHIRVILEAEPQNNSRIKNQKDNSKNQKSKLQSKNQKGGK